MNPQDTLEQPEPLSYIADVVADVAAAEIAIQLGLLPEFVEQAILSNPKKTTT